ncbi:hypothetical protein [Flammeovirga kamogawensis]|uniref:Uncharacterized protein n=1 Tax=Flammeovirga kamogawensis TaxID=373891 RepID=A0ABX8GS20_9BACT|nr:hypothetical protein [Flammeovirga kamogawensis]MBB6462030.1 hypothetical protein [Flammeovirga kamogawensis]QWG05765.1 hypothetical protein KM029_10265 [Flammeovirga kamogawensis]TRX67592.1 hypothetical protein EO216_05285 [Flammeovirga kamogawensis]
MQRSLRARFYIGLLKISMLFSVGVWIIELMGLDLGRFIYIEIVFNAFLAVMSYEITCLGALSGDGEIFHGFYVATVFIRVLLSLTVFTLFFIFADADKHEKLAFILSFFFFYFAYTIFEIVCLFPKLQGKSGNE